MKKKRLKPGPKPGFKKAAKVEVNYYAIWDTFADIVTHLGFKKLEEGETFETPHAFATEILRQMEDAFRK